MEIGAPSAQVIFYHWWTNVPHQYFYMLSMEHS